MKIVGTDVRYPFVAKNQIQLCSIDLRMSNIFWRQKNDKSVIDLGPNGFSKVSPRRGWKRMEIQIDESIVVKPGELLIGRTYEKFKVPKFYAGKIVAKSSIARLGVSLFCSTDFINPGWEGHIPLIIKNHGINPVKIRPLLTVCQIMLITLSSVPQGEFGKGKYRSSYQNDDGGPTFWWRDQTFSNIRDGLSNVTEKIMEEIFSKLEEVDDEGLARFEKFMNSRNHVNITNSTDIIAEFLQREKKKEKIQKVLKGLLGVAQTTLLGLALKLLFDSHYTRAHYIFWTFTCCMLPFTIWYIFIRDETRYYPLIGGEK